MKTYVAVKAEIAKLEKQAEGLRKKELKSVIAKVQELMAQYELTVNDLGLAGKAVKLSAGPQGAARPKPKAAKYVGVPKYCDPKTNKTWTGRGKPPNWIAGVKQRDSFLIVKPTAVLPKAKKKAKPAAKSAKLAKSVPAAKKAPPMRKTAAAAKAGAVKA